MPLQITAEQQGKFAEFCKINSYVAGSYDKDSDFQVLDAELKKAEVKGKANRLFYLALPPSVYAQVTGCLKRNCMTPKYVMTVYAFMLLKNSKLHAQACFPSLNK